MKKLFRILVVIATTVLSWPAFSQAPSGEAATPSAAAITPATAIPTDQQPTPEQLHRLFEAMRLREQLKSLTTMMPAMVRQQLNEQVKESMPRLPGSNKFTPEQEKAVRGVLDKYMQKALHIYTPDEMLSDMTAIYQRHFTRDDVDAFIAFYTSPAGRHLLEAQPQVTKEYMPVVMQRVQERSTALAEQERQEMNALIKSFGEPAQPAGSTPNPK